MTVSSSTFSAHSFRFFTLLLRSPSSAKAHPRMKSPYQLSASTERILSPKLCISSGDCFAKMSLPSLMRSSVTVATKITPWGAGWP